MKKYLLLIASFILTLQIKAQTVSDVDGNTYNTVTIGTQVWMKENLKTTKYRNGDLIGTTTPATLDITAQASPKYQWAYDGNEDNALIYGRLYTWYAATDSRNVCPTGWHLPTDAEWTSMENYLIANGYNYDGTTTENKIAKSLAATTTWEYCSSSCGEGVPGKTDFPAKRNATGFTALGAGCRIGSKFGHLENATWWWTSLNYSTTQSRVRQIITSTSNVVTYESNKLDGFSVRCIKDDNTSSINMSEKLVDKFIYPNPATDKLFIKNSKSSDATVAIFDIQGKQVINLQIDSNPIDISNLSKGIYLVKIVDSGNIIMEKLIKE